MRALHRSFHIYWHIILLSINQKCVNWGKTLREKDDELTLLPVILKLKLFLSSRLRKRCRLWNIQRNENFPTYENAKLNMKKKHFKNLPWILKFVFAWYYNNHMRLDELTKDSEGVTEWGRGSGESGVVLKRRWWMRKGVEASLRRCRYDKPFL